MATAIRTNQPTYSTTFNYIILITLLTGRQPIKL